MTVKLTNTANVTDSGDLEIAGANTAKTAVVGGITYLFVGGSADDGVSVFRVGADGSLVNVANAPAPAGVSSLEVVTNGTQTFLYVAGFPANSIAGYIFHEETLFSASESPYSTLGHRPQSITSVVVNGNMYLFSAASLENSIHGFQVGLGGKLTSLPQIVSDGGVSSLASAVVGGSTFLFAAGRTDDGISVFSVAGTGALTPVANVTDDANLELDGAISVTTAVVGGTTFLFAAGVDDDGVSVFRVGADGSLTPVDNVTDGESPDLRLDSVISLTTATIGGKTLLFAAAQTDDGVSVFEVGADGSLTHVANVADGGGLELDGATGITTATVGGATYFFATGLFDSGVSAFLVEDNSVDNIYVVDDPGDVVDESGGGGIDTVVSSISFSLAAHGEIENLTLTGAGDINGTGNALANILVGNAGANILDGGLGADTMQGLAGNDTYVVDDSGDVVDEAAAGSDGIDTVLAAVSFTLGANVENLTLIGSAAIDGAGNDLANTLTGNAAANILTGGLGADSFLFNTGLDKKTNVDTLADFSVIDDTILLDNSIFTKLKKEGALKGKYFEVGKKADDKDDYIVYNKKSGDLFYDKNGDHKGGAIKFAVLEGSPDDLSKADFLVI